MLQEPINESKKYTKGDKLHVKLKSGKEFDVVFDSYSSTDGIAFGRIDGETKPFSLNAVVESLNEAVKYKKGDKIRIKPSALKSYQDSIESSDSNWCIPVYTFVRYTKKSDETKFPNIVAIRNGKYEDLPIGDVIPFKGSIKIESINEDFVQRRGNFRINLRKNMSVAQSGSTMTFPHLKLSFTKQSGDNGKMIKMEK